MEKTLRPIPLDLKAAMVVICDHHKLISCEDNTKEAIDFYLKADKKDYRESDYCIRYWIDKAFQELQDLLGEDELQSLINQAHIEAITSNLIEEIGFEKFKKYIERIKKDGKDI